MEKISLKQHIIHPFEYSSNSNISFRLSSQEKIKAIALLVFVGILTAGIGGVVAFYCATAFYKTKKIKILNKENSDIPPVIRPIPPKIPTDNTVVENVNTKPKELSLSDLTIDNIKKMSPDQKGAVIDEFGKRDRMGRSVLNKDQLQAMVSTGHKTSVKVVNFQELGLGHCGRYCINNALQREALTTEDFQRFAREILRDALGVNENDNAVFDNEAFGVDVDMLQIIFKKAFNQSTKFIKIDELPNFAESKQNAIEDYIGESEWIIIANEGEHTYDMPSLTNAIYPFARGHFVAARKDENQNWWYVDSRASQPVNIDLALLPSTCTIVVPEVHK